MPLTPTASSDSTIAPPPSTKLESKEIPSREEEPDLEQQDDDGVRLENGVSVVRLAGPKDPLSPLNFSVRLPFVPLRSAKSADVEPASRRNSTGRLGWLARSPSLRLISRLVETEEIPHPRADIELLPLRHLRLVNGSVHIQRDGGGVPNQPDRRYAWAVAFRHWVGMGTS